MSKLNDYDCFIAETYPSRGYYGFAKNLGLDSNILELTKQFEEEGFDSTEIWNLDHTIVEFILPRLKYYRETHKGYPSDLHPETWLIILNNIIYGFEELVSTEYYSYTPENREIREEAIEYALDLFRKYFRALWD